MYLVTTQLKPNKRWGIYKCRVFHINNLKDYPSDVTDQVAQRFDLSLKDNLIEISFGSWTWFNRIKDLLEQYSVDPMNHSLKVVVRDVSL